MPNVGKGVWLEYSYTVDKNTDRYLYLGEKGSRDEPRLYGYNVVVYADKGTFNFDSGYLYNSYSSASATYGKYTTGTINFSGTVITEVCEETYEGRDYYLKSYIAQNVSGVALINYNSLINIFK